MSSPRVGRRGAKRNARAACRPRAHLRLVPRLPSAPRRLRSRRDRSRGAAVRENREKDRASFRPARLFSLPRRRARPRRAWCTSGSSSPARCSCGSAAARAARTSATTSSSIPRVVTPKRCCSWALCAWKMTRRRSRRTGVQVLRRDLRVPVLLRWTRARRAHHPVRLRRLAGERRGSEPTPSARPPPRHARVYFFPVG